MSELLQAPNFVGIAPNGNIQVYDRDIKDKDASLVFEGNTKDNYWSLATSKKNNGITMQIAYYKNATFKDSHIGGIYCSPYYFKKIFEYNLKTDNKGFYQVSKFKSYHKLPYLCGNYWQLVTKEEADVYV